MKMLMRSSIVWTWITIGLLALPTTVSAQNGGQGSADEGTGDPGTAAGEETESARGWGVTVEATTWFSQPVGTDYVFATARNESDPYGTSVLEQRFSTDDRMRWRFGYRLGGERGAVVVTYWSQAERRPFSVFAPGNFAFGELLAYPRFAGVRDDGLADAVTAETGTATRDLRVDFVRAAFRGDRVTATWSVGIRSLDHSRRVDAQYWALLPGLPALIEPTGTRRPDLIPAPDTVATESAFSGRGPGAGVEIAYELHKNVSLEFGLGAAVLRGYADARYISTTHFYDLPSGDTFEPIDPHDYETVFSDPDLIGAIQQRDVPAGIGETRRSTSAFVIDAQIGFRWRVWRALELLGGFRAARYEDVARELRLSAPVDNPNGATHLQGVEGRDKGIGYEGFYLGLGYSY